MDAYCYGVIFFLIVQWITAALRVFVRTVMVKRFGWDDAAMLLTLGFSSAFDSLALAIAFVTGLQPVNRIKPTNLIPAMRMTLAVELVYICGSVFLKIALGLLLLRVLVTKWQKLIIHLTLAVSVAYGAFYFLFVLFQCGHPTDFVERIVTGQCLSSAAINGTSFTHAALNAAADIIFLLLPVALLWKADMSMRSKISVGSILGLGSLGGICTVVRIAYIDTLTRPTFTYFQTSKIIVLMSAAELSIGLTCICLSTFKPLIRCFFLRDNYYYYDVHSGHQASVNGREMYQMQSHQDSWLGSHTLAGDSAANLNDPKVTQRQGEDLPLPPLRPTSLDLP